LRTRAQFLRLKGAHVWTRVKSNIGGLSLPAEHYEKTNLAYIVDEIDAIVITRNVHYEKYVAIVKHPDKFKVEIFQEYDLDLIKFKSKVLAINLGWDMELFSEDDNDEPDTEQ
jgi:hypothetical protein